MRAFDWAGAVGETWAEEWPRTDRTFAPVDAALVDTVVARLAGARIGAGAPRILDVGCGAGRTSLSLAGALPTARITGIDLSPALIAVARDRAAAADADEAASVAEIADRSARLAGGSAQEALDDVAAVAPAAIGRDGPDADSGAANGRIRFVAADAATWADEDGYDLVASRHGVMFFDDPVAALAQLRSRAARGAALVFSCFRAPSLNPWASRVAALAGGPPADPHAPGPFAFADEDRVARLLGAAGWRDAQATPLDFAYVAGAGADPVGDAMEFFARIGPSARALAEVQGADRDRLREGLAALVHEHLAGNTIVFPAAAWIWSATA